MAAGVAAREAELLTRVDRKYLLLCVDERFDVLQINGRRVSAYTSTYFDSPDLSSTPRHRCPLMRWPHKSHLHAQRGLTVGASAPVSKTIIVTLTASPAGSPTASFTASGTTGVAPLTVGLTDTSMGNPTSWAWNFGNGATSAFQYPF